ncbi:hypothetical protein NLN92_19045 [Citrobacter portucalensis]|uniref:hypothetical protein n=1 Tax=Citrobacter portucalensis TaxID=1639133 RepID=UPI00226B1894|nr:hypothetical protein [Citrobacter portucalensis]MCX8980104.1 hypothetical protein [Citrobacter portucalensis]
MTWDEHKSNFKELQAERGISVKDYAELYGLNYNTARRMLRAKPTENDHSDDQKIISKGDQPAKKAKSKPSKLGEEPKPIVSAGKARKGKGADGGAGTSQVHRDDQTHMIDGGKVVMLNPKGHGTRSRRVKGDKSWKKGAQHVINNTVIDNSTGEPVGNDEPIRRVRTGIYQQLTGPDIQAALNAIATPGYLEVSELDALATAIARRDMLVRVQEATLRELDIRLQIYNGLIQPGDDLWDDLGEHPKNPIYDIHKVTIEGGYALADAARTISQIRQNIVKERLSMWKLQKESVLTPQLIDEALTLQAEHGWSEIETAQWLERRGVKLPATILFGAMKQLKEDDGIADDGETMTTVDPEQVEKEARLYAEMRKGKDLFLTERRAIVADIVDRNGYGDLDADGQRREGEGLAELDDEEFDAETLHQQYGEEGEDENWEDGE